MGAGKGAPGSTFVAINIAAAMATKNRQVVLVDLDLHGGDLAAYLGLDPRSGLHPLMRLEGKHPGLDTILGEAQKRAGVACIPGFPSAETSDLEMFTSVFETLHRCEQIVIADVGRITPATAPIVSKAGGVLLVVRPDVVGVYAARRCIDTLKQASEEEPPLAAVVNGWEWKRSGDLAETVDALSIPVAGTIPFDRAEAHRALTNQRPLRKGKVMRAFRPMAAELFAALEEVERERVPA